MTAPMCLEVEPSSGQLQKKEMREDNRFKAQQGATERIFQLYLQNRKYIIVEKNKKQTSSSLVENISTHSV